MKPSGGHAGTRQECMSPSMIYSHHSSSVPPCASVTASVTASVCVRCVAYVWQRLADHRGSKTAAAAAGGQASVGTEATWPQAQRSEQLRPAASHFQPGIISTILRARSAGRLSRVGTQRVKVWSVRLFNIVSPDAQPSASVPGGEQP